MKKGDKYTVASDSIVIVGVLTSIGWGFAEGWEMHCGRDGRLLSMGPFTRKEETIVALRDVVEIPEEELCQRKR